MHGERRSGGFTLIELVMVLVLVGVLSALGIGLFANRDDYAAFAARDQWLATARLAQQRALASSGDAAAVTLVLQQDPERWLMRVQQGSVVHERVAERSGARVRIGSDTLADGASFSLTLGPMGRPDTGVNLPFVFAGESAATLCLATSGFAYPGTCQP